MFKERVGAVTENEKNEIMKLYERKLALQELMASLKDQTLSGEQYDALYEKIVADTGKTKVAFEQWWHDAAQKYQWTGRENGQWQIDFKTNEIFLVEKAACTC